MQTIGEGDIRSNLLRGQSARRRPTADMLQTMRPHTIADDEVLANLSRRKGSLRRLRRVSTIENASVLPVAARVSAYGGEVVKPQASRPKAGSALGNRFAPYPPRKRAEVPPPDATVVEPPAAPATVKLSWLARVLASSAAVSSSATRRPLRSMAMRPASAWASSR